MIKYRFALDKNDKIIDIQDLERASLAKTDIFFSIDSKQELIPRLGKIKRKHFAQKPKVIYLGNQETYLHALGKKIFFNEYSNCLQKNLPFYLKYKVQKNCNRLQKEHNIICKLGEYEENFDLTKYFTEIQIEKKDNNFIPDILLFNPKTNEKIYIEIAVTHNSSDKKKHSGQRIIEFNIKSENDIQFIIDFKNGNIDKNVQFYNFKLNQKTDQYCNKDNCQTKFYYFSVANNGKCNLNIVSEKIIKNIIERYKPVTIWSILEPEYIVYDEKIYWGANNEDFDYGPRSLGRQFKFYVAKAFKSKVNVKNCYLCRYHAENTSWEFVEREPIFCKFQKITCGSNNATKCQYYKIEQKYVNEYLYADEE